MHFILFKYINNGRHSLCSLLWEAYNEPILAGFFRVWIFQNLTLYIVIFKTNEHQYILIYLFLMKRKQNIDEMITIHEFRRKKLNSVYWIQIWNLYIWIQCTEFKFETSTFEFSILNSNSQLVHLNSVYWIQISNPFIWIQSTEFKFQSSTFEFKRLKLIFSYFCKYWIIQSSFFLWILLICQDSKYMLWRFLFKSNNALVHNIENVNKYHTACTGWIVASTCFYTACTGLMLIRMEFVSVAFNGFILAARTFF